MRCFIAAWPDAPTHLALAALSEDVRQRIAHRRATCVEDLHLTLAFIGDLADDDARAVAQAVASMQLKTFDWPLNRLGFFAQAGVLWAGAGDEASGPLLELGDRARRLLDQMAVDFDRRALTPHVTLLRGVKQFDAEEIAPPILWRVDAVALYRSGGDRSGARYSRVAC